MGFTYINTELIYSTPMTNLFGITSISLLNLNNTHIMLLQITREKCTHFHSTCGHSINCGVLKLKKKQKKSLKPKVIKVKFKILKTKQGQWLAMMYITNLSRDIQKNNGVSYVQSYHHQSSKDSQ